jgi:hypothetical protein
MNKKKIFGLFSILGVIAMMAYNVNVNSQNNALSDVALDNVEALAHELDEIVITCGPHNGRCWTLRMSGGCCFSGYITDWCF